MGAPLAHDVLHALVRVSPAEGRRFVVVHPNSPVSGPLGAASRVSAGADGDIDHVRRSMRLAELRFAAARDAVRRPRHATRVSAFAVGAHVHHAGVGVDPAELRRPGPLDAEARLLAAALDGALCAGHDAAAGACSCSLS